MADRIGCNRTEVCFFAMLIFIYSSFWCVRALDNNGFECPSSCICVGQEVECQQNPSENKVQQLSGTGSTSLKYEDKEDIPMLSRQRRNVAVEPSREPRPNRTNTPVGAALFPCDFEEDFCQWYHSSDSDFKWSRNKGATPSSATGPTTDHTSGAGWYIYTEASIPRRYGDRARLTSPTLAANNSDAICKMEFFVHMRGSDIGALNVYQAPVEGHDILKKSWSGHQGTEWFKGEVTFDSRETFQIIVEGVRGRQFRGDIALDDFVFSSGCRRRNPSYVRLVNGTAYNNGLMQVWRERNWHQVCSTGWTTKNSDVGCRELGFVHAINSSLNYPLNMSAPVVYNVSCNASEDSVNECRISNITEPSQCSSSTSASVVCSGVADVCPSLTHLRCPADAQGGRKCISRGQLCDFHNDCWNSTDEMNCANYTRCSFEEGFCGWLQGNSAEMNWTRHRGNTPSRFTGPSADHNNNKDKYYLYIEVSGRQGKERARLGVAPRFQGNHAGLCKVRFWFHMLGLSIGTLRVYAIDKFSSQIIWSKSESRGNLWGRAEVTLLNTSNSFQVIFEAEHIGYNYQGDIAIDDVSFTPECRPAPHEIANCTAGNFPCNSGECVPLDKLCDFSDDCFDASDELNCGENSQGRCNFDENFCGWTNPTNDDFDWTRQVGETPTYLTGPPYDHTHGFGGGGYYIYIEASYPRQRNDKAQLLSPQFMLSDVKNCKMRFFYHMYGSWVSVGTLNVKLLNTITGATRPLWHMSGNRGKSWHQAEVVLDTSWPVVQVMFEGHRGLGYQSDIAIDDVSFSPECYPPEAIHVLKNYDIRLADGGSSNEGRVEIFRVGQWGTVCTDEWDRKEADVVCGQLGYSHARVVSHSFGPGSGQIWLDNLACFGNESKLYECPHNGWAKHDCTHRQDAGVICNLNGARKAVRLAGNRKHSRHGRVEIFHNNEWSSICIDGWDLHDGHVACTQLGFSGIDKITKEPLDPNSKAVLTNMGCHGNETSLDKCEPLDWGDFTCLESGSAGVECKDKDATDGNIRLVSGTSFSNGRVEIFYRGEWGTICEDKWTATNARVTCLQLGFTHVSKVYQSYGPGKGRIWMDQVNCNGNEASLADCPQRGWGVTDCFHSEDVGVICSDEGYIGCYIDRKPAAMMHISSSPVMTIVMCMRICQARGYQYAGLQWSSECHCANQSDKYGKAPDEECNTPCSGDYSKKCGGTWRLSVYNTNPAILPSTSPGYAAVRQSCERYIYSGFPGLYGVTRENSNYFAGNHRSGKIWSPNFPLNYPDLMKCVWVLNLYPDTKAHIEFEHFETESFHDRITIKDGKRNFDDNLTPRNGFSGHNASSVTASSNLMWIQFESDFSVNEKGFRLVYEARGITTTAPVSTATPTVLPSTKYPDFQYISGGCDGIIDYNSTFGYHDKYHDSGYIKSPNYPYSYPANSECRWSIYVLEGFRVKVSVVALEIGWTGSSLDITDDYVTWHMDKKRKDLVFISKENYVKVTFVSTSNVSGEGFKIEYERFLMMSVSPPISDEGGVGAMIGVVVGVVLALILIVGVLVAIKKKKQQRPHAVRHNFVNQAYDGVGDVNTPPATEPAVHYAVAPPPYSQITPVAVPVSTAELTPVHEEGAAPKVPTYAQLYAIPVAPPVYEAGVVQATGATTTVTGLGSVTNVREGTAATSLPGTQPMTGNRRSVLPPIRGRLSGSASVGNEEKKPITGSEAGPLPQKVPLVVDTPAESRPSAPSQSMVSVRSVSPPLSATDFDEEPPFEFLCPITNQMMSDPVTADDGKTYERNAIRSWLRRNPTSPMTGNPLVDETLKVNHELKAKIEDFKRKHSKVVTL